MKALKDQARAKGVSINDAYSQFFREVFLHELMGAHPGWVLKGGSNIYCRIPGARQTQDLDLYRQDEPVSSSDAAQDLIGSMDGHRVGPYTFRVQRSSKTSPAGMIDSERIDVLVVFGAGGRFTGFKVDVSGDLQVNRAIEPITVPATYEVEADFLPRQFQVHSYPVANQVADKVCAMYERHGVTPPGKASTRYRDLYDIALIALELTVEAADLQQALATQCEIRQMTLPERITAPDEKWLTEYPAKARKFGGSRTQLEDVDEALRIAALLIDPLLPVDTATALNTWDPHTLVWIKPRGAGKPE